MGSLEKAILDDIKTAILLLIFPIIAGIFIYVISEIQKILPSPLYSITINTINTTTALLITVIASLPPITFFAILKIILEEL